MRTQKRRTFCCGVGDWKEAWKIINLENCYLEQLTWRLYSWLAHPSFSRPFDFNFFSDGDGRGEGDGRDR